ncbi:MAG: STAS domain-containing protein [Solirubrobacteraceae bacterium]
MTADSERQLGGASGFSLDVEPERDAVRIALRGELDLATVGQLERKLTELVEVGFAKLVIDLRGVDFVDSTGLHALLTVNAAALRDGWTLSIIPGPPAVQRLFEITSTLDRLPFTAPNGGATASKAEDGSYPPNAVQ